jgi:flagellar biogenesis protein FliO
LHRNISRIFHASILCVAVLIIAPLSTSLHAQEGGAKSDETPQVFTPGETNAQENGAGEAPDYEYEEPAFNDNRVSYPFMILRTIAVMGVIIIGIYFLFRLLIRNKNRVVTDSEIIKILATYPLAANRIIQVVDIGGQVLVLGVSDSSINLITELEDQEIIDRIRISSSKEKTGAATFKDTFMSLLGGKPYKKPGQISQLSGYKKRINRLRKF